MKIANFFGLKRDSDTELTIEINGFAEEENLYEQHCVACHQASSKGMRGASLPLVGSNYLMTDKQRTISIPLKGLKGEIFVNGEKYNAVMPNFAYMKDGESAAIMISMEECLG